jgi:hypothetical protein
MGPSMYCRVDQRRGAPQLLRTKHDGQLSPRRANRRMRDRCEGDRADDGRDREQCGQVEWGHLVEQVSKESAHRHGDGKADSRPRRLRPRHC